MARLLPLVLLDTLAERRSRACSASNAEVGLEYGRPEVHRQIAWLREPLAAEDAPTAPIPPTHHSRSLSANMPPHASFVGAELSITLAWDSRGRRGFPQAHL